MEDFIINIPQWEDPQKLYEVLLDLGYLEDTSNRFRGVGTRATRVYLLNGMMNWSGLEHLWTGPKWKTCRQCVIDISVFLPKQEPVEVTVGDTETYRVMPEHIPTLRSYLKSVS